MATHADPRESQFIANFRRFLQKNRELLITEFICREKASEVADSRFKHAMQGESD